MKLFLNQTFYYYRIFVDMLDFSTYIDEKRLVTKIFLIISLSDLSLFSLLDATQQHPQFFEKVYVFSSAKIITSACFHTTIMDDLFIKISNDIMEKINPLNRAEDELCTEPEPITTHDIDKALPSLSVFNSTLTQATQATVIRHLTKESFKFVSFLIMRDILIRNSYEKEELVEMCVTCRGLQENDKELKSIDQLKMNYDPDQAIKYYTQSSFLCRTINKVCGTENMEEIYKFRKYIRDLHKKLEQVDKEQKNDIKPLIEKVYRGKPLAGCVLQQLIDNKGGLISINGFLSTTVDPEVASMFAGDKKQTDEGHTCVRFEFEIDKEKEIKLPYAYIPDYSTKPFELEVLFSPGTIWRIKSIRPDKNPLTIELTSCEEFDSKLNQLLQKYTDEPVTLTSLGNILLDFGNESEAEWCYRKMLDQQCNDDETSGTLHYKIGMIQFKKKLYDAALINLVEAERFLQQSENKLNESTPSLPINKYCAEPPLLKIYNHIGLMHEKNSKFEQAIKKYEQAIKKYEQELNGKSSNPDLAMVHNNLGFLHFRLGNYITAYEHQKKACKLGSNSPPSSIGFEKNLKRTKDHLDCIADDEERKAKRQKTTADVLV
jgi:hypothetical protein